MTREQAEAFVANLTDEEVMILKAFLDKLDAEKEQSMTVTDLTKTLIPLSIS